MDSSILVVVTGSLFLLFLLQRLFSRGKLPPGPTGLPFLGYIPFLSPKPHLDFQRLAKKYGDVFSVQMGSEYVVVLNDFESTKKAFSQDAFIGRPQDLGLEFNKETIESEAVTGQPWIELRKFTLHMLKELGLGKSKMEEHIQEEIGELLESLEQNADKPFCIHNLLAPSMSNNIGSLFFGKRLKYSDPQRKMLTRVVGEMSIAVGQSSWQLFFPTIKKIFKYLGIGNAIQAARSAEELKTYVINEMKKHKETLNSNNIRDFIDGYLLEIEKRKNDPSFCKPVLEDLVAGFFLAGSESVRLSVEWLILAAARYPDGQRRIQREIDEVMGRDRQPAGPDQKSMPYTQAFTMEMLRWKSFLPLTISRYAIADGEIGGYFIPKHSQILSNLWAIHHDPEYWGADAEEFRPERFLTEDEQEVKKWDRFIPFSIGKRPCPGELFARIEIFLYFTSILQKFDITVPDGNVLDFEGELGLGLAPKPQELIFAMRN